MLYRLSYAPPNHCPNQALLIQLLQTQDSKDPGAQPCLKRALLYQLSYGHGITILTESQELTGIPHNPRFLLRKCWCFSWPIRRHPAQVFDSSQLVSGCDMCVSHRHLDRLMPQQFGQHANVDTGHHQAARERMPQAVPSNEAEARLTNCRVKPVLVALQRLPLHINKNSTLPTGPREQLLKCRQRDRVQRFNGMCRVFRFLLLGIVISLRTRSTLLQIKPYCLLGLIPVCRAISNSGIFAGWLARITALKQITELRNKGYTFVQIAEELSRHGIEVEESTLRLYRKGGRLGKL